jgi:hypothetical protein
MSQSPFPAALRDAARLPLLRKCFQFMPLAVATVNLPRGANTVGFVLLTLTLLTRGRLRPAQSETGRFPARSTIVASDIAIGRGAIASIAGHDVPILQATWPSEPSEREKRR